MALPRSGNGQSLGQIQWQQSFGGTNQDSPRSICETADGGYLIAGFSASGTNGNKTSPNLGGQDYWLVRIDPSGNKIWERTFGGTNHDRAYAAAATREGGFVVGGESFSSISGNKTSPNWGGADYWVLLLDGSGNQIWEASFGGSSNDVLSSVRQTSDGGFILGGWSFSGMDGNKTSTNFGGADAWLVRLDGAGNKLWDRTYGGTAIESNLTLEITGDDGFIFGVTSTSSAGGNKTNEVRGAWVVRLDRGGNMLWEWIALDAFAWASPPIAATVKPATNGEFLVGCSLSYDCCGGVPCRCMYIFLSRLDTNGHLIWSKQIWGLQDGGGSPPILVAVRSTADGGYVTGSTIGDGSGFSGYYMYRLDSSGEVIWYQKFGRSGGFQSLFSLEMTSDGGFILGGNSGQQPGGNKTSPHFGSTDYWIVKLFPEQPHLQLLQPNEEAQKLRFLLQTSYFGSYAVDRSTDLATWQPWQTNSFNGVTPEFIDFNTSQTSQIFYRARRLP